MAGRDRANVAFVRAAAAYWLDVFPDALRELSRWTGSARRIPDPRLRDHALLALRKRGNMEGAAAFAAFAPKRRRAAVAQATVAFQTTYNYLDLVSERHLAGDSFQNARVLHQALVAAVNPHRPIGDCYRLYPRSADAGHVARMVEACRQALVVLPSFQVVAPLLRRAADRVVAFQAHQARSDRDGGLPSIESWARRLTSTTADIGWVEVAGAAGSSLGVHALIAAAAEPRLTSEHARELDGAYFPWIGALHSLLDHLIDIEEDARCGQRNLIALYSDYERAIERMEYLARRALREARTLPGAPRHELIVGAMAAFYLSEPEARTPAARPLSYAVAGALSPRLGPPLAVFRVRKTIARMAALARVAPGARVESPQRSSGHRAARAITARGAKSRRRKAVVGTASG